MAPNRPEHPTGMEIIDLDSDTSDEDSPFMGPVASSHVEPSNLNRRLPAPAQQGIDPKAYQKCLEAVLAVFPDISHDHVQQLWNRSAWGALIGSDMLNQTLIERILDEGAYPKEKDRLRELKKRKRASPEAEAAKWRYADLRHDPEEYARVAKARLMERFDLVPLKFISDTFKQHAHYYGAFFAIDEADRRCDGSVKPPFQRLKAKRTVGSRPEQVMASLEAEGHDFEGLKEEMRNADARWQKEENNRKAEMERCQAKEASDEEYRRRGETMECACCFSDDNPPTDMTHCNADIPHFFCFVCAKQNAETDMTSLKYTLRCMDQSRCEATFSRQERAKFLDTAAIDKLERLQQQDEIRRAEMGDLEACPFCEYAAICPPPDVDRVFECQNPDCMEASCRLCKEKSHVPLSCKEFKKENGICERHAVEEARTEALIRSCKKCKVRILKEDGCNKVVCTNCYSTICDYCGEDISRSKYEHFDGEHRGPPSGKGKCPLYDASNRKEDQIEKAGKAAMEKVRKENPNLSEEDLKIKFAKVVQDQSRRHRRGPDVHFHPADRVHLWRQRLQAVPPAPLPAGPVGHLMTIQQQQLQNLQMHQVHVHRRMQREMQRVEANPGDLHVEVDEGQPQYRQGRHGEHTLMGYAHAMGFQPHQPALGQLANGAGTQPPRAMPMFGPPLGPLPVGNGPALGGADPVGWQRYHPMPRIGPPPGFFDAPTLHQAHLPPYQQPEQAQAPYQPHPQDHGAQYVNSPAPRPHPAPQPVLQQGQALNGIDAEFVAPNGPIPPVHTGVGPHFRAGVLAPPFDYNPPGPGPPMWVGDAMNAPNNLEIAAGMGLGQQVPDFMNDADFEAFIAELEHDGNGGQAGQGLLGFQGGQRHLDRVL